MPASPRSTARAASRCAPGWRRCSPAAHGDATQALADTLALLEGEFAARRVTVTRDGETAGLRVPLDNESLKQVFLNLMLNALEAMQEGGRITVTAGERRGRVEV